MQNIWIFFLFLASCTYKWLNSFHMGKNIEKSCKSLVASFWHWQDGNPIRTHIIRFLWCKSSHFKVSSHLMLCITWSNRLNKDTIQHHVHVNANAKKPKSHYPAILDINRGTGVNKAPNTPPEEKIILSTPWWKLFLHKLCRFCLLLLWIKIKNCFLNLPYKA